jgi:hypothetical protein
MTLRQGMIEWLGECFEEEDFASMSTATLMEGIERHWDGGMRDFLDCNPDLVDIGAMSTLRRWTRKRYSA